MFYSLTGKATVIGDLYDGSMLDGDREATAQEMEAYAVLHKEEQAKCVALRAKLLDGFDPVPTNNLR